MFSSNLMSLNEDPALPDLIPEDYLFDDLLNADNAPTTIMSTDVNELKRELDSLIIECNTLNLRLEIEKTKRQRLQSTVRQLKRDVVAPPPDLLEIRNELNEFKRQQDATNYLLDGENARTNTLTFRSVSRICQLLTTMIPGTAVLPEAIPEMTVLLHELSLTAQQFGVYYTASYVWVSINW